MILLFVSIFAVDLLNTKMRENAKGRIFIAWLLFMTLMPFFMVKTFHYHEEDAVCILIVEILMTPLISVPCVTSHFHLLRKLKHYNFILFFRFLIISRK